MFSYDRKKEKYEDYKKYIKGLENEYVITFNEIEFYINESSKLNLLEKNNCFLQILDTFLSAQEAGKPVNGITGLDLKKYCDDMIYGQSIYSYKLPKICFILLGILYYISFINFFSRIFKGDSIIFSPMSFGVADIILILGCICIPNIISRVTRNYFKNPVHYKKIKKYTYYVVWLFTIINLFVYKRGV